MGLAGQGLASSPTTACAWAPSEAVPTETYSSAHFLSLIATHTHRSLSYNIPEPLLPAVPVKAAFKKNALISGAHCTGLIKLTVLFGFSPASL